MVDPRGRRDRLDWALLAVGAVGVVVAVVGLVMDATLDGEPGPPVLVAGLVLLAVANLGGIVRRGRWRSR